MTDYPVTEKKYFISEKIDETQEVLIISMRPEDGKPTPFDPGMFMMVYGVDKQTGERHTGRALSIASGPSSAAIEFFIIKNPTHGEHIGKSHFADVEINDPFVLKGPSGQFRFDPAKDRKVLFIAGGTGLAPFMSMLRHMKVLAADTDVVLLYSIKYPGEIIRKQELQELENTLKLKTVVTVTRPAVGDGWNGEKGHVDLEMIRRHAPDLSDRMAYVCGPLAFVKAVTDALAVLGVSRDRVSADVWG